MDETPKVLRLPESVDDETLDQLNGTFVDDKYVKHKIDYDCDIYDSNDNFILSFRKNRLQHSKLALDNYKTFARPSRGRGASAGPIDPTNDYWKKRQLTDTKNWRTGYLVKGKDGEMKPSKMRVNNQVFSNPIGYFDASRGLNGNLPCRLTSFTKQHLKQYQKGLPYIEEISDWYRRLHPVAYNNQLQRAQLKPDFQIGDTPFSTFTCNRNFRTALHKDKGDFGGIACLSVLEEGEYSGGLFTIPKYGIGVDLRMGDILVANVHQYHANTEFYTTPEQDLCNKYKGKTIKENKRVGTAGINYDFTRISFVCYLREKMIKCD
jgi:type II secretory pathway pseudopilin PulG